LCLVVLVFPGTCSFFFCEVLFVGIIFGEVVDILRLRKICTHGLQMEVLCP
jgi:hypothetical protein